MFPVRIRGVRRGDQWWRDPFRIVTAPFRVKIKAGIHELVDFPGHTVTAFKKAGFHFWQKIVVIRNPGSAGLRGPGHWRGKTLCPSHEELLVFRTPFKRVSLLVLKYRSKLSFNLVNSAVL